ncbi:MAG: hypothetical protein JJ931_15545 [Henriciella sp.]|nr:hypothetical protein [Henriciella sp.]
MARSSSFGVALGFVIVVGMSGCALAPEVPEGCRATYEQVYQPDPDGAGAGRMITVYTGYKCSELDHVSTEFTSAEPA